MQTKNLAWRSTNRRSHRKRTKLKVNFLCYGCYGSPHVKCETGVNHNNKSPHDAIRFQYVCGLCITISGHMIVCLVRASRVRCIYFEIHSCSFNTLDDSAANGLVLPKSHTSKYEAPSSIVVMSLTSTQQQVLVLTWDVAQHRRSPENDIESRSKPRGVSVSACSNHIGRKLWKASSCLTPMRETYRLAHTSSLIFVSFLRNKRNWFFTSLFWSFSVVNQKMRWIHISSVCIHFIWLLISEIDREWSLWNAKHFEDKIEDIFIILRHQRTFRQAKLVESHLLLVVLFLCYLCARVCCCRQTFPRIL